MTSKEYNRVLANIPRMVAVFQVTTVPVWASRLGVVTGDHVTSVDSTTVNHMTAGNLALGASHLRFTEYREV